MMRIRIYRNADDVAGDSVQGATACLAFPATLALWNL